MVRIQRLMPAGLGIALVLAGFAPATALHAQSPITLRLASPDQPGRPSEGPIRYFADEVARLSGGTISIEPDFGVSSDDPALPFEQYAASEVSAGNYELALIASRGWDKSGVTTPWALQAPFLIDNDALAVAVAKSDIANAVMDGMTAAGVTGLSLWPEDLRHPFAFAPFGKPFLTPADFAGTTIRAIPSHVGYALLTAFGANPVFKDGYGSDVVNGQMQGAESGLLQGANLLGNPVATGNVTFFPKYEMLVANSAALAQLSDDQRAILQTAAVSTRDHAIETRTTEAAAGDAWCSDAQGRIVEASDDQVAAFQAAAAPVYADLEQDPATKAIIDSIRALKAQTPASAPAAACEPAPRPTPPTTIDPTPATAFPDGTYRAVITQEDLIARGWSAAHAPDGAGTVFMTIADGVMTLHFDGDDPANDCAFPFAVAQDVVRITIDACWEERSMDFQWTPAADGIELTLVAVDPSWEYADDSSWFGRTWERVE